MPHTYNSHRYREGGKRFWANMGYRKLSHTHSTPNKTRGHAGLWDVG